MDYRIQNQDLKVVIETKGAELKSIIYKGKEYLWQRDPKFWKGASPVLFPMIGRLFEEKYTYEKQSYSMGIHGFVRTREFEVNQKEESKIVFTTSFDEDTLDQYPFKFHFNVSYELVGETLVCRYDIENLDNKKMYFGIGGHPGINLPLEAHLEFEDYRLSFEENISPKRVVFGKTKLYDGYMIDYPLVDSQLSLKHSLFDDDAIVLENAGKKVTLSSPKGERKVSMEFDDFAYIGFWHMPETKAPYVCLEPWSSLPGREEIIEALEDKADLESLDANAKRSYEWKLSFE